jgi:hypothetical protein
MGESGRPTFVDLLARANMGGPFWIAEEGPFWLAAKEPVVVVPGGLDWGPQAIQKSTMIVIRMAGRYHVQHTSGVARATSGAAMPAPGSRVHALPSGPG